LIKAVCWRHNFDAFAQYALEVEDKSMLLDFLDSETDALL